MAWQRQHDDRCWSSPGELLFAVVKTTTWVAGEEAVRLGEVQLVLGDGFVVSVDRDGTVLERVRQDLEDDPELAGAGPSRRSRRRSSPPPGPGRPSASTGSPARYLEFRRAVTPLTEMLDRLATESPTAAGERLKQRYRERRTHPLHLDELADGLGNLLSNVLQANLTEVSVRQNDDMRRISAWVAIWAIPTLLAGIHGRNFRHLPELEWAFGYPLVLVMMALICLGLYRGFRRSGWL
jgi:magnesium transporter